MSNLLYALMTVTILVCGCIYLPGCTTAKNPPVITSFSASPASINPGGSTTLNWTVTGAKSVSLDNGIGNVAVNDMRAVAPAATTVYILTATNVAGSTTASTQVAVQGTGTGTDTSTAPSTAPSTTGIPAISSFSASPNSITAGASSTLSWSVANATSINIQPGIGHVAASGSTAVAPGSSTQYILTATNSSGSNQASTQVIVSSATGTSSSTTGTSSGATGTATAPATFAGPFLQLDPVAPPPLNDYMTIYDFIAKAPAAYWLTNERGLQFPGTQEDSRGFALVLNNATLEDNKVYSKVLETHPPWKTDSMIRGVYNDLLHGDTYTPQAGDHFTAKVGFLKGATSGDVKFRVMIRFDDDRRFTGDEIHKTYDGTLTPIVVPLATYRGRKINIELEVWANNTDAKQDWAVWVDPKITRHY